eukprot:TRINITY_DN19867_c0_g1_i2.p1 TRINITY_DN19867_c0_g1~~TRINITY_DN19867_c0_g1_i2.p1  ORF type:complete len:1400 (+),score=377.46 TRINITY_DN19867_c0_g1_i2:312-4202(+)
MAVTVYQLLAADGAPASGAEGALAAVAPVPLVELHTSAPVRCVALSGDVVAYCSSDAVWCVDYAGAAQPGSQAPEHLPLQPAAWGPDAPSPLSSGTQCPEPEQGYLEVRFRLPPGSGGEPGQDAATETESMATSQRRGGFFRRLFGGSDEAPRAAPPPAGETPARELEVSLVEGSGAVHAVSQWRAGGEAACAGPVLLTDHRAFRPTRKQGAAAGPQPVCRLLLKHRMPSGQGPMTHLALLEGAPAGPGRPTQLRLLTVVARQARLHDVRGGGLIARYDFPDVCSYAASSSLYLFAATSSGTVDVYALHLPHPCDEALDAAASARARRASAAQTRGGPSESPARGAASAAEGPHGLQGGSRVRQPPLLQRRELPGGPAVASVACTEDSLVVCFEAHADGAADTAGAGGGPPGGATAGGGGGGWSPRGGRSPAPPPPRSQSLANSEGPMLAPSISSASAAPASFAPSTPQRPRWCLQLKIASTAEVFQDLAKDARRRVAEPAAAEARMHDALHLLHASASALELSVPVRMRAATEVAALAAQLELANARALHAAAATLAADFNQRQERLRSRSGKRLVETDSRIDAMSNRSGGSTLDAVSESHFSVPGSSYGDIAALWADEAAAERALNGSTVSAAVGRSTNTLPEPDESRHSWLLYAYTDRSLRHMCSVLKHDHAPLLAYLDVVLFGDTRPPLLSSAQSESAQLVSEEAGNMILRLYARHSPARLCAVVWDSWLGRAKGGAACFSAAAAAEALRHVSRRIHRGALVRRKPSDALVTTGSQSDSSHECEEGDRSELSAVQTWASSAPREDFVIGLLLLEEGDVGGCVESWDRVDLEALCTLVASSRHLWEPDMRAAARDDGAAADEAPDRSVAGTPQSVGITPPGGQRGQAPDEPATVGALLALYFPAALPRVLAAARARFGMSVDAALRLLRRVPHRSGLLVVHFLCSIVSEAGAPDLGARQPPAQRVQRRRGADRRSGGRPRQPTGEQAVLPQHLVAVVWQELAEWSRRGAASPYTAPAQPLPSSEQATPLSAPEPAPGSAGGARAGDAHMPPLPRRPPFSSPPADRCLRQIAVQWPLLDFAGEPPEDGLAARRPAWMLALDGDPGECWGGSGASCHAALRDALTTGPEEAAPAALAYLSATLGGLLTAAPQVPAAVVDAIVAAALSPNTAPPGCQGLAVMGLLRSGRPAEALHAADGVLPSRQLIEICESHSPNWGEVLRPLIESRVQRNDAEGLHDLLARAAARLPLAEFVRLLPPRGAVRFFLPLLERAVDQHNSQGAKGLAAGILATLAES